jgi:hypothetical protein
MVTPILSGQPPHSFTASPSGSRGALVPWWSLLLSTLALATLGAMTAAIELPPLVGAVLLVSAAGCCAVLVVAELVHRAGTWRTRS